MLLENSLYKDQAEYDEFIKDREKVANTLIYNLFGFISLFAVTPKREVKEWKNNEKRVRIEAIGIDNTDVSIAIKMAYDAKMITRTTADKLTKLLALFKQGKITKASEINDDLIHELFVLCKFDTVNKPSTKLRELVKSYIDRETNISFLARTLYRYTRLPEFNEISKEFFSMYKTGGYAQVYSAMENGYIKSPMGVPQEFVKKVTDKTVIHKSTQVVDPTGLSQIIDAVDEIEIDTKDKKEIVRNVIDNVFDNIEVVPQVLEEPAPVKPFNHLEDETDATIKDPYKFNFVHGKLEDKYENFDYKKALSSQESFVEEYIKSVLANFEDARSIIRNLNKYYYDIQNYIEKNLLDTPEWMLKDVERIDSFIKSTASKDGGVYQALFVITMSYLFAKEGKFIKYAIRGMYDDFGKMKGENAYLGGSKKAKENSQELIKKYSAKINFKEFYDKILSESKMVSYFEVDMQKDLFGVFFPYFIFNTMIGGGYEIDERINVLKDIFKKVTKKINKNYDEMIETILTDKKYLENKIFYMRVNPSNSLVDIIVLNSDYEDKILPVTNAMQFIKVSTIKKFLQSNFSYNTIGFLIEHINHINTPLLEIIDDKSVIKDFLYGLRLINVTDNWLDNYVAIVDIVLGDILSRGSESVFDTSPGELGIFLDYIDQKSNEKIKEKIDIDKYNELKANMFDYDKMYSYSFLEGNSKKSIAEYVDIYYENKDIFIMKLIEQMNSTTYKKMSPTIFGALEEINKNLDDSKKIDFSPLYDTVSSLLLEDMQNDDRFEYYLLLEHKAAKTSLCKTTKLLDIYIDMIKDDDEKYNNFMDRVANEALSSLVFFDDSDEFIGKYDDLIDRIESLTIISSDTFRINHEFGKHSTSSEDKEKIKKFYERYLNSKINSLNFDTGENVNDEIIKNILISNTDIIHKMSEEKVKEILSKNYSLKDIKQTIIKAMEINEIDENIALYYNIAMNNPHLLSKEVIEEFIDFEREVNEQEKKSRVENLIIENFKGFNNNLFEKIDYDVLKNSDSSFRKYVLTGLVSNFYDDIAVDNTHIMKKFIENSPYDILSDQLDDASFVKLAKINGIGINSLDSVDISEYADKEELTSNIRGVLEKSFDLDIRDNQVMSIAEVQTDNLKEENIKLYETSNGKHGNVAPIIEKIYHINMDDTKFKQFVEKDKENPRSSSRGEIRRFYFHGTGSIATTFISKFGFREIPQGIGLFTTGKMLGAGIYLAKNIDKSLSYIGDGAYAKSYKTGYIFVVDVCLGQYNVDFLDGKSSNVLSEEWCIKNFEEQILVKKIYKVKSTTIQEYTSYIGK